MNEALPLEPKTPTAPVASTSPIEPTKAATAPWWKNMPVLIAALAFILSVLTSLLSAYTAYKKDVHDQQAELSAIVQKLLQIPVTRVSLSPSIQTNDAANLESVFVEQQRMLTVGAYGLARRLGSNAPAPELMTVAILLASFQNYRGAKQIWRQATLVADNFSDEVSALRQYGIGMIRFAQSDSERAEGERAFEEAMNIGSKYPDVARNPAELSFAHVLTQLAWTDVWSAFDCTKAEFHLHEADKFAKVASADQLGGQVQSMTQVWHEALRHCDENRTLPFQWRPENVNSARPPPNQSGQTVTPTVDPQLPPVVPMPKR